MTGRRHDLAARLLDAAASEWVPRAGARCAALLVPSAAAQPMAPVVLGICSVHADAAPPSGTRAVRAEICLVSGGAGAPFTDVHVRVELPGPPRWPDSADVLLESGSGDHRLGPAVRATYLAARYPGALVVAVRRGARCLMRIDPRAPMLLTAAVEQGRGNGEGVPWPAMASMVHAWVVAGLPKEVLAASTVNVLRRSARDGPKPQLTLGPRVRLSEPQS